MAQRSHCIGHRYTGSYGGGHAEASHFEGTLITSGDSWDSAKLGGVDGQGEGAVWGESIHTSKDYVVEGGRARNVKVVSILIYIDSRLRIVIEINTQFVKAKIICYYLIYAF